MIRIVKIQIDQNKQPIGLLGLFTQREFLTFFLILPMVLSTLGAFLGIILGIAGIYAISGDGFNALEISVLCYGYVSCVVFALMAVKKLFSLNFAYSIRKSRTVILTLGISFFIATMIGGLIARNIVPILYYDSSDPAYETINSSISFFAMPQLLTWILGGFILIHFVLVSKIDFSDPSGTRIPMSITPRKVQTQNYLKTEKGVFCERCGKHLPLRARYCNACAYPVNIPQQKEVAFRRVSFKQAVDLLDSETYPRSSRMNIEFECLVLEPASPEQAMGPAPHRKIWVTDPGQLITRTLYIWGDPNKKHNINLAGSLEKGDRLLIMGPNRPKDDPRYYRDDADQDVFWITSWDGTALGNGTRLLKLHTITPTQVEEESIPIKSKDIIEFTPETPVIQQDTITPPFYCQLCSIKHPAGTPRMQCDVCGRYVCIEAFADMARVGRTNCPMCDGKLISI